MFSFNPYNGTIHSYTFIIKSSYIILTLVIILIKIAINKLYNIKIKAYTKTRAFPFFKNDPALQVKVFNQKFFDTFFDGVKCKTDQFFVIIRKIFICVKRKKSVSFLCWKKNSYLFHCEILENLVCKVY